MLQYLDQEHTGGVPKRPARVALVQVYLSKVFHEFKLDLDTETIASTETLGDRVSFIDPELMKSIEIACMENPRVKEKIAQLQLPDGARVLVEPWTYGTDGLNDMSRRISMVLGRVRCF